MKQKILEGEILDETQGRLEIDVTNQMISASAIKRVNKSVMGPRTTKNGQHLRKIAEGLGDLNISKMGPSDLIQPSRETR
jgi:hypothetical protein